VTSDNFKPKDLLENEKIQRQNSQTSIGRRKSQ